TCDVIAREKAPIIYDERSAMRDRFHWARLLAFVTGLVTQELLLRNEYFANRLRRELSVENRNDIRHEADPLDRELNALIREMEQEEVSRRVIEMLVMLGSDEMLQYGV